MADQINTTNTPAKTGGNGIAFIVGILVVVVAVLAYVVWGSGAEGGKDISVTIEGAADAVEGTVASE